MIKWIKNLLCKIIGIKQCQCPEDEHVEYFTKVPEPEIPVHEPQHCKGHRRFRNNCDDCRKVSGLWQG